MAINYYRPRQSILRSPRGLKLQPVQRQRLFGYRDTIVLNQQYVEIVNPGDPASIYVRLNQQYLEAVNTGDPSQIFVRLNQQYLEVVMTFGSSVVNTKKDPPGQKKKADRAELNLKRKAKRRRDSFANRGANAVPFFVLTPDLLWPGRKKQRRAKRRHVVAGSHRAAIPFFLALAPDVLLPPPARRARRRKFRRIITISPVVGRFARYRKD